MVRFLTTAKRDGLRTKQLPRKAHQSQIPLLPSTAQFSVDCLLACLALPDSDPLANNLALAFAASSFLVLSNHSFSCALR